MDSLRLMKDIYNKIYNYLVVSSLDLDSKETVAYQLEVQSVINIQLGIQHYTQGMFFYYFDYCLIHVLPKTFLQHIAVLDFVAKFFGKTDHGWKDKLSEIKYIFKFHSNDRSIAQGVLHYISIDTFYKVSEEERDRVFVYDSSAEQYFILYEGSLCLSTEGSFQLAAELSFSLQFPIFRLFTSGSNAKFYIMLTKQEYLLLFNSEGYLNIKRRVIDENVWQNNGEYDTADKE